MVIAVAQERACSNVLLALPLSHKIFSARQRPQKLFTMVFSPARKDHGEELLCVFALAKTPWSRASLDAGVQKLFTTVFSSARKLNVEDLLCTPACREALHHGVFVLRKTPW